VASPPTQSAQAADTSTLINGDFEADGTGTATPAGWSTNNAAGQSDASYTDALRLRRQGPARDALVQPPVGAGPDTCPAPRSPGRLPRDMHRIHRHSARNFTRIDR
jgi:hypothetical protein